MRRPSRRGVSRNKTDAGDTVEVLGRPSRRGVSRNSAETFLPWLRPCRPSRRGVSRNLGHDVLVDDVLNVAPRVGA